MNKFVKTALAFSLAASVAVAGEFPIGDPVEINGMEIAAVYLEPIDMEPKGIDLAPSKADIHLEADIHAIEGNKNGFAAGEWIPYLKVNYELKNLDNGKVKKGTFMPMVAQDGPHYGANIKFEDGVGKYKVKFEISAPGNEYLLHTDPETGVTGRFWTEPLVVEWDDFEWNGPQW